MIAAARERRAGVDHDESNLNAGSSVVFSRVSGRDRLGLSQEWRRSGQGLQVGGRGPAFWYLSDGGVPMDGRCARFGWMRGSGPCTAAWAWWCPGAVGPAGATAGPTGPRRAPALHRARRVQGAGLISRALLPDDGLCRPAAYCSPPGGRAFLGSFGRRGAVTVSSSRLFSGTSSVCLNRDRQSSCVCRQLPTANAVRRPPTQYS